MARAQDTTSQQRKHQASSIPLYEQSEVEAAYMRWANNLAKQYRSGLRNIGSSDVSNQDIGKALRRLRDGRLYRETHRNFYVFCAERFGIMPDKADDLISKADNPHLHITPPPQKIKAKTLCVYFIEGSGLIKIGYTENLRIRLASLQTGSPVKLNLLASIPGDKLKETELHTRFAADRRHGEWFAFSAEIKAFLETL
jgi:hypothetical protein